MFSAAIDCNKSMHISKAADFGLIPMELCTGASLRMPLLKCGYFYYNLSWAAENAAETVAASSYLPTRCIFNGVASHFDVI